MSVGYSDLFTDLGKILKYFNTFLTVGQTIPGYVDVLETTLVGHQQSGAIDGLRPGTENDWMAQYTGRRATLAAYAGNRLQDPATVAIPLGVTTISTSTIFPRLVEAMLADAQTVKRSTVALGSVTPDAGNVGNGTVLVTKLLDAVTSPGIRQGVSFPSHHDYAGLSTELCCLETMTLRCTADSYADPGTSEGAEPFSWIGGLPDDATGVQTFEGSGDIGSALAIHANTSLYLANADFETFTVTNTPDSWTIDAGTVTTNILAATSSNAYHGSNGLRLLGDGATAAIQLSQAITTSQVTAGKMYCVTCRLKASAAIAAGDLTIQFEGTGYSAGASEKITVAHGALPTSWTLESFFVLMPLSIPDDFKLVAKWTGTPTNAKNLYLDDFGMGEVNYGGGLGVVAVRGSTPFVRNDLFTFTVTPTEGVFQKFFRRVFGWMLPSAGSGGETIADSLAS